MEDCLQPLLLKKKSDARRPDTSKGSLSNRTRTLTTEEDEDEEPVMMAMRVLLAGIESVWLGWRLGRVSGWCPPSDELRCFSSSLLCFF